MSHPMQSEENRQRMRQLAKQNKLGSYQRTPEQRAHLREIHLAKDPEYFKKLGQKGGKATGMKGFAVDNRNALQKLIGKKKLAVVVGAKGGKISRRGKAKV